LIKDTQIPIDIPNNTLTEEIMKVIGVWLNTEGNLIDLFGMHNNFSEEYLLDRNDILWNGRNNFKFLKVRIANQRKDALIGINRSQGLINFEIVLNGITQYMILLQFITIRTFKKLILKRLSIHDSWLKLEVEFFGLNEDNCLADITNFTNTINIQTISNDETTTILFYKKGNVQIDTRSNDNINSLKKILIKRYLLSPDIVLTDKYLKPYPEYQLIKNIQTNIYICIKHEGIIKLTGLKRTKYIINNAQNIDEFEALYYNGWNLYSLNHYMNLLIGGARKKMNILIDGNVINNWREPIENNDRIVQIFGTIINGNLEETPDCLIATFKELEIKGIMINGNKFMKAVYAWNKMTINYALTIWGQNINFFPSYNYVVYNNSVMRKRMV
jgi:hypothetical protein